jgi:mannose-6-phosphate isomerase-like protein (cupin superfamily)
MIIRKTEIKDFDFNGLAIADYTAKCGGKSSFAVIAVQPGVSHQLSWSTRSDKYYYVMNGKVDFTVNDEQTSLKKGDFCIITKGVRFLYKNSSTRPATLILVHTPGFKLDAEVFA